mmetsp:Transcript_80282/g.217541  ORF Transcript_80282/g.217541 Transcript_80282/m.217541 type:complete len:397 (+) Transcript_80282:218-1408(+)
MRRRPPRAARPGLGPPRARSAASTAAHCNHHSPPPRAAPRPRRCAASPRPSRLPLREPARSVIARAPPLGLRAAAAPFPPPPPKAARARARRVRGAAAVARRSVRTPARSRSLQQSAPPPQRRSSIRLRVPFSELRRGRRCCPTILDALGVGMGASTSAPCPPATFPTEAAPARPSAGAAPGRIGPQGVPRARWQCGLQGPRPRPRQRHFGGPLGRRSGKPNPPNPPDRPAAGPRATPTPPRMRPRPQRHPTHCQGRSQQHPPWHHPTPCVGRCPQQPRATLQRGPPPRPRPERAQRGGPQPGPGAVRRGPRRPPAPGPAPRAPAPAPAAAPRAPRGGARSRRAPRPAAGGGLRPIGAALQHLPKPRRAPRPRPPTPSAPTPRAVWLRHPSPTSHL